MYFIEAGVPNYKKDFLTGGPFYNEASMLKE